jgi:hypothetical protein
MKTACFSKITGSWFVFLIIITNNNGVLLQNFYITDGTPTFSSPWGSHCNDFEYERI